MRIPSDMMVEGNSNASDSADMAERVNSDIDTGHLHNAQSLEHFERRDHLYNPYSPETYWVEMTPDAEHWAWVSYGHQNTIGRDTASNSIRKEWLSSIPADFEGQVDSDGDTIAPIETAIYDDPVPPAYDGTPAKAIRKVNRSKSQTFSAEYAQYGASYSHGENTIVTDYLDLNGDRYPDIVGTDMVQYSRQWGGIGPVTPLKDGLSHGRVSVTNSFGSSYSASTVTQERTLCGSQGNAKFTLKCEGSRSASGGGNVGRIKGRIKGTGTLIRTKPR